MAIFNRVPALGQQEVMEHVVLTAPPYQTAWVLASLVQITVPTPQQ